MNACLFLLLVTAVNNVNAICEEMNSTAYGPTELQNNKSRALVIKFVSKKKYSCFYEEYASITRDVLLEKHVNGTLALPELANITEKLVEKRFQTDVNSIVIKKNSLQKELGRLKNSVFAIGCSILEINQTQPVATEAPTITPKTTWNVQKNKKKKGKKKKPSKRTKQVNKKRRKKKYRKARMAPMKSLKRRVKKKGVKHKKSTKKNKRNRGRKKKKKRPNKPAKPSTSGPSDSKPQSISSFYVCVFYNN